MSQSKYVTIMVIPDGAEARRGFRIRLWLLKVIIGLTVALLLGILFFFIFYGDVLSRAAMTERLREENQKLLRYQYKVKLLEENLKEAREIVSRLTQLAGIDYQFPELVDDSTFLAAFEKQNPAVMLRPAGTDMTLPTGLPVQGFISKDFEIADTDQYHPGVDIACAEGTPVLATAQGTVVFADFDSTYGYMVILQHNDSIATIYGHNSRLLVETGQEVPAAGRIALSGNTGKSTAPHVHYEVRIHDQPINPLDTWYDKKNEL
ncbi:MAG: M23 family metallopeptidase [Candidatus Zixiibacteriota bacterium]